MWSNNWRTETWAKLDQPWDIIVIGGGITGAGVLREATRAGLRGLLVEQRDFAWGTSSRSSKLVHGGLRYLKQGGLRLTRAAVRERERLLDDGPGLIDPLGFLLATYKGDKPGRRMYGAGLSIYDLLALQWSHRFFRAADFRLLAPLVAEDGLQGGFQYGDAQTDDSRLVLRLIREAVLHGASALNYTAAEALVRDSRGQVNGVVVRDLESGRVIEACARVVVNATGAWADRLRADVGGASRIRPLRGSHLIFAAARVPVDQALGFLHPLDRRPVFIFPWEGITLVGTTDVDHTNALDNEPAISADEVAYLMAAVEAQFPSLGIGLNDIIATFAGIRPVIDSGKIDPSKESRDHVVWKEAGLLTVAGGKLTTFRRIALDVLKAAKPLLPYLPKLDAKAPVLEAVDLALPAGIDLNEGWRRRLLGRHGIDTPALLKAALPHEIRPVPGARVLWAELRWAARAEGVVHLDDLLLRRVRLGLLLPQGGADLLPRVRAICQAELGWDDARWDAEQVRYLALWRRCYSVPDPASIPDWRPLLADAKERRQIKPPSRRRRLAKRAAWAGAAVGSVMALRWLARRRRK